MPVSIKSLGLTDSCKLAKFSFAGGAVWGYFGFIFWSLFVKRYIVY